MSPLVMKLLVNNGSAFLNRRYLDPGGISIPLKV